MSVWMGPADVIIVFRNTSEALKQLREAEQGRESRTKKENDTEKD